MHACRGAGACLLTHPTSRYPEPTTKTTSERQPHDKTEGARQEKKKKKKNLGRRFQACGARLLEQAAVAVLGERDRAPGSARARGAADAVQVPGQAARRIVVDHGVHAQDVQPARRNVRRQQECGLALLETADRLKRH